MEWAAWALAHAWEIATMTSDQILTAIYGAGVAAIMIFLS